ncbi:MAG: hypothetical protein IJI19_02865 [Ruminococcus sp.]|nr:hypothetical protein [Ruminococcus sp.]
MSEVKLTEREREYLDCETPMITKGSAAARLITGFFAGFFQTIFAPSSAYNKVDKRLMRTIREIRYTKYKKAVLRKQSGTPKKNDEKLLKKLNQKDFIFDVDNFDPDAYAKQLYEEYMKKHPEKKN